MTQNLKDFLIEYNTKKGYGTGDADLLETLCEENIVSEVHDGDQRWWSNYTRVVQIDDKFIEYFWAKTTGDMTAREAGWEFDWSSVREVHPKQKIITVYE
jgi:hypothetical protein